MMELVAVCEWSPHPKAAPITRKGDDGALVIEPNGTRTCVGGWLLHYAGFEPGQIYSFHCEVDHDGLESVRDALRCVVYWTDMTTDLRGASPNRVWDSLLPETSGPGRLRFSRVIAAPDEADRATVACVLRWATMGRSQWTPPRIAVAPAAAIAPPKRHVRVCAVTGQRKKAKGSVATVQDNVARFAGLCEAACEGETPDLIALPEIALQIGLGGDACETAVAAPGAETDVFAAIAKRHRTRVVVGMIERDGDAVFNSAVLISPHGEIDGKYRKVHLATGGFPGEYMSSVRPGDGFPVYDTEIGRIGCNICKDSSYPESSRMVGLGGADFLVLPIMGDHRAAPWDNSSPRFDEDRWRAIMRVRAMDNQLCLVVARNAGEGSCVIDRSGAVLAYNPGDRDFIAATVDMAAGYRVWNGGCFREDVWLQRRPERYGPYVDPTNYGPYADV